MSKITTIQDLDNIHKLVFYNRNINLNNYYKSIENILNSLKENLELNERKKLLNSLLWNYLSILKKSNLEISNIINMEIDLENSINIEKLKNHFC